MNLEFEMTTRPRITGIKIDENMVKGLLTKDIMARDKWLVAALKNIKVQTLAAVEEAIARKCKKQDIIFFQTGGTTPADPQSRKIFADRVIELAKSDQFLTDPAKTQSFMARVGQEQHNRLMKELLDIDPEKHHIYQLLGIQMQLAILLEHAGKIETK